LKLFRLLFGVVLLGLAGGAYADIGGILTPPAGTNGNIQFNKRNSFGADPAFSYSTTTKSLSVSTIALTGGILWPGGTYQTSPGASGSGTLIRVEDGLSYFVNTSTLNFVDSQFLITEAGGKAIISLDPSVSGGSYLYPATHTAILQYGFTASTAQFTGQFLGTGSASIYVSSATVYDYFTAGRASRVFAPYGSPVQVGQDLEVTDGKALVFDNSGMTSYITLKNVGDVLTSSNRSTTPGITSTYGVLASTFVATTSATIQGQVSVVSIKFPDGTVQVSSPSTGVSTSSFISNSTSYIQNSFTPSTTSQVFSVSTGAFTRGILIYSSSTASAPYPSIKIINTKPLANGNNAIVDFYDGTSNHMAQISAKYESGGDVKQKLIFSVAPIAGSVTSMLELIQDSAGAAVYSPYKISTVNHEAYIYSQATDRIEIVANSPSSTSTINIGPQESSSYQNGMGYVKLNFIAGNTGTILYSTTTRGFFTSNQFTLSTATFNNRVYISTRGIQFPDGTVQVSSATGGGGGDITAVVAGYGLEGGAIVGDATLSLSPTSTSYIQNSNDPSISDQKFKVSSGTFTNYIYATGAESYLRLNGYSGGFGAFQPGLYNLDNASNASILTLSHNTVDRAHESKVRIYSNTVDQSGIIDFLPKASASHFFGVQYCPGGVLVYSDLAYPGTQCGASAAMDLITYVPTEGLSYPIFKARSSTADYFTIYPGTTVVSNRLRVANNVDIIGSSLTVQGQVYVSSIKFPDGTVQVSSAPTTGSAGGGDNLGNHIATKTISAQFGISGSTISLVNTSTYTAATIYSSSVNLTTATVQIMADNDGVAIPLSLVNNSTGTSVIGTQINFKNQGVFTGKILSQNDQFTFSPAYGGGFPGTNFKINASSKQFVFANTLAAMSTVPVRMLFDSNVNDGELDWSDTNNQFETNNKIKIGNVIVYSTGIGFPDGTFQVSSAPTSGGGGGSTIYNATATAGFLFGFDAPYANYNYVIATLDGATSPSVSETGPAGTDFVTGDIVRYKIYSYKTVGGVVYYSTAPAETSPFTFTQDTYQADISWTHDANADGYKVVRSLNSSGYTYSYDAGYVNSLVDDSFTFAPGNTVTPKAILKSYVNQTSTYGFHTEGSLLVETNAAINGRLGIGGEPDANAPIVIHRTDTNYAGLLIKHTEHTSTLPSAISIMDSANNENIGLTSWNGGGGTGGYGSVVVAGYGGAGIRLGEIGAKNQLNGYRVADFIFQTGASDEVGQIVTLVGTGGGGFGYAQYITGTGTSFGTSSSPSARVQMAAGTTSIPPMRFASGSLATGGSRAAGNVEFLTDKYYGTGTTGTLTREFAQNNGPHVANRIVYVATDTFLTSSANFTYYPSSATMYVSTLVISGFVQSSSTMTVGSTTVNGKLTVTGAIDPYAVIVASTNFGGSNIAYYEARSGSATAVSPSNAGRIIYDAGLQKWRLSANGSNYVNVASTADVSGAGDNLGNHQATLKLNLISATASTASLNISTGATPSSPVDGDIWYSTENATMRASVNGISQDFIGRIFVSTNIATVSNTTSESTLIGKGLGTLTLPANFFKTGRSIRMTAAGYYSTAVTAPSIRIQIKKGSTVILDTAAKTPTIGSIAQDNWDVTAVITATTPTQVRANSKFNHLESLTTVGNDIRWDMQNGGGISINSTAEAMDMTVTFGTGSISNSMICTNFMIEAL
jgi:hypothetical protein